MSSLFDIIYIPIGFIFRLCYQLVGNYGVAIIVFAVITKLALFPLSLKNEKNRIKTQQLQPKMQALQKKYKNNTKDPKYSEELQKLYAENGNPMTGCLWQFLQLPLIWAIWNAIRRPLSYVCDMTMPTINSIAEVLYKNGAINISKIAAGASAEEISKAISSWTAANEINLASAISSHKELVADILEKTKFVDIDFSFLGLNLGATPTWTSWTILIPIISGLTSFLVGFVSQKMINRDHIKAEGAVKTNMNLLLYVMPIVSVIIGFGFSIAVGMYWIFSNILSIVQTVIITNIAASKLRKSAEPAAAAKEKEKKLNYNQIQKMERMKREQADINLIDGNLPRSDGLNAHSSESSEDKEKDS